MFGTIRKHQNWLWAVIIVVIIISFVVYFSPDVKMGRQSGPDLGKIHGRAIERDEFIAAREEVLLDYRLKNGAWPGRDEMSRFGFDIEGQTRARLLLLDKIHQMGIQVSDEAVADFITTVFQGREKKGFSPELYQQVVKQVLPEANLRESDLHRYLRNQMGIRHLNAVVGLSGRLVTSRAAEAFYQRDNEQVAADVVIFEATNYLSGVTVTTNMVASYYTNHLADYRIPDRVQVNFVFFASSNYLADAEQILGKDLTLTQRVDMTYQQRGTNTFMDASNNVMSATAAKDKIRDDYKKQVAMQVAQTNALQFANELFAIQPVSGESLLSLAAKKGLPVRETEPFTQQDGPKDLKAPAEFARQSFQLTSEEPFAPPFRSADGIYLVGYKKRIPSEIPPLESVQTKVTEDFRNSTALEACRLNGIAFHSSATNGVAQGKTFVDVAKTSKYTPVTLPLFSRSTRSMPEIDNRLNAFTVIEEASRLLPGSTSPFVPTREGGFVLHVRARFPVAPDKLASALPAFTEEFRDARQSQVFEHWFQKEFERSGLMVRQKGEE
jgi:hypothetical protein